MKTGQDRSPRLKLVIYVRNDDYPASLEPRKVYCALADRTAAAHGLLRVIDESGEDYSYPSERFAPIALWVPVRRALRIGRSDTRRLPAPSRAAKLG